MSHVFVAMDEHCCFCLRCCGNQSVDHWKTFRGMECKSNCRSSNISVNVHDFSEKALVIVHYFCNLMQGSTQIEQSPPEFGQ